MVAVSPRQTPLGRARADRPRLLRTAFTSGLAVGSGLRGFDGRLAGRLLSAAWTALHPGARRPDLSRCRGRRGHGGATTPDARFGRRCPAGLLIVSAALVGWRQRCARGEGCRAGSSCRRCSPSAWACLRLRPLSTYLAASRSKRSARRRAAERDPAAGQLDRVAVAGDDLILPARHGNKGRRQTRTVLISAAVFVVALACPSASPRRRMEETRPGRRRPGNEPDGARRGVRRVKAQGTRGPLGRHRRGVALTALRTLDGSVARRARTTFQ